MAENIREAIEAMERLQRAAKKLREETNHATYSTFRHQMSELSKHLTHLQTMLHHEDEMALDELADALAVAFHSHPSDYRHVEQHPKEG
jgi:DNA-binding protein H-NS